MSIFRRSILAGPASLSRKRENLRTHPSQSSPSRLKPTIAVRQSLTPSDIKLNHDVPLPNIVAWSQQAQPEAPLASTTSATTNLKVPTLAVTVVAPTPETIPADRQRAPSMSQTVVAPAPEVNVQSSARTLQAPESSIVAPAPRIDASSARRLGDINVGHTAVVAPAPMLPLAEQYAVSGGRAQPSTIGGPGPAVVPPPPSVAGNSGSNGGGRLIALGIHPTALPPAEMPGGNRRGTFAATPSGKPGAAGTPDISATNNSGTGSGSSVGKNLGVPSGLSVGAAPNGQKTTTMTGQGQGNGTGGGSGTTANADGSRLAANVTPPGSVRLLLLRHPLFRMTRLPTSITGSLGTGSSTP